jgi:hypothetical protein
MVSTVLGPVNFEVSATDKEDALFVAKQVIERSPKHSEVNYRLDSIRVIKKV